MPKDFSPKLAPSGEAKRGAHGLFVKGHSMGRPFGSKNRKPLELKEIAHSIVFGDNLEDYIAETRRRIRAGDAPHLDKFFHELVFGKPKETIEVSGTLTLAHVLAERLLTAKERALAAADREHFDHTA